MKPNFALNLTHESIVLLHRAGRGWTEIGEAMLDSPDLGEALTYLRRSALGLSPAGFSTKLIIPNSQILYDRIHAPGPDEASRRAQIEKALEGRTPYAVDELAYDYRVDGDEVMLAIVARETLAEAEQFAAQYKFNPVSFVAIPDAGTFAGEPFFGPAQAAAGQEVGRDAEAVTIQRREFVQEDTPGPVPEPEPEQVPEPEPEPAPPPEPEPEPLPVPPPQPQPEPQPAPGREIPASPDPMPAAEPDAIPAPPTQPEIPQPADPAPAPTPSEIPLSPDTYGDDVAEAPVALDVESPDDPATSADDDLPPPPPAAILTARGTRVTVSTTLDTTATAEPTAAIGPAPPFASRRQPAALRASRDEGRAATAPAAAPPAAAKAAATERGKDAAGKAAKAASQLGAATAKSAGKAFSALVTAPGISGLRAQSKPRQAKAKNPATAAKSAQSKPAEAVARQVAAAPAATSAGASSELASFNRLQPQRGKPRFLGLILTGILLVILAVVAAWSSLYLASTDSDPASEVAVAAGDSPIAPTSEPADATIASGSPDPVVPDSTAELPVPDDEMLADGQDPMAMAAAEAEGDGQPVDPAPASTVTADSDAASSLGAADTAQDEIVLSAMDAPPQPLDPLALPRPEGAPDTVPAAQVPPPPFGTFYEFDDQGRILPTAEGVVTPDGVLLIAGRPPLTPPARPVIEAPPAEAAVEAALPPENPAAGTETGADAATTDPDAITVFQADPAVGGFRPRGRPEGLTPPAEAVEDTEDDASLAIPAESRFASLRPKVRPAAVVAAAEQSRLAEEARKAAEAASLAAAASAAAEAAVAEEAERLASASPLAVQVSRRPAARPADLSRAVQAAAAAAVRTLPAEPAPAPEKPAATASAASVVRTPSPKPEPTVFSAPEADDEPEVTGTAKRSAPKGVVAKNATFVNAINLSKLNLIGVYGTQSKRYALIREPNGRYKKIKVGDRLDGGRVAAITASEVRYQKGGRMLSLAMPKG